MYKISSNAADMKDTGFYVIFSSAKKGRWVTSDIEPYGEIGDISYVQLE